jgi:hypothetical protein
VPMAHAEVIFVDCEFSVPKPAINDVDGQQYVGARLDADNCHTKLRAADVRFLDRGRQPGIPTGSGGRTPTTTPPPATCMIATRS